MTIDSAVANDGTRDRYNLRREELLADYAAISKKRRGAAEVTSLRLRSRQYLDILSAEASNVTTDWAVLREWLLDPNLLAEKHPDPMVLAEIGRVLLLQQLEETDFRLGLAALNYAVANLPKNVKSRRFRKLIVEYHILDRDSPKALELLDEWPDVDREFQGYLRGEILNPFFANDYANHEKWLENFNRGFVKHGISPVKLRTSSAVPFDGLEAEFQRPVGALPSRGVGRPKVSVILTTFNPGREELRTSVRSILEQTLENIEVIVVDDASDEAHRENVLSLHGLDERISIVHASANGGTYKARNLGLEAAKGEYITGQDDDDWSHPERLAEQVAFLESNPKAIGCRISSYACLPNLSRVRLGYKPVSANASSLMMRREAFDMVGGFLEARKAADTELYQRAENLSGRKVVDIEKPLAIVRIEPGSLSRSEFRAGWSHAARREFKFSYTHWHNTASRRELMKRADASPQVFVPRRFRVDPSTFPEKLDVVYAGDWRQYGGPQKSMIEEIRALTARGYAVGVLQLEAPRFMSRTVKPLTPHIQELINDGSVVEVLYDDPISVDLLILRYPPILQFALADRTELRVGKMLILANQAPSELDGSDIRYLVPDCTDNARTMFSDDVCWVPQGAQVREAIEPYLEKDQISSFDMPGILDPEEWWNPRRHRRSTLPVVGRHSRDNKMKWPDESAVIEKVYPVTGRFDVRILGGASIPREVLGLNVLPAGWTVYETDALPVPAFLRSLEFYVFYQNSIAVEAFGRSILEAIAARLVVILPHHYEEVFGEAAVYADPANVQGVVMKYHNDRELYAEQLSRAEAVVRDRFSHEAYEKIVSNILKGAER